MSESEFYEFTFNWTIKNFLHCFKKNGKYILSPIFQPNSVDGSKWFMQLYPKGSIKQNKEYISLFLLKCGDQLNEKEMSVNHKWELVVQDTVLFTKSNKNDHYKNNEYRGYEELFSLKELRDNIKECGEDKITIRCHITRSEPKICNAITRFIVAQYSFRWKILKPDSSDWLESKKINIHESLQLQIDITAPVDDVLIKIKLVTNCLSALFMKCTLSLLNTEGHPIKFKIAEYLYDSSTLANNWEFPSFFNKSELEKEEGNIFKDGAFTLVAEISYSKDIDSFGDCTISTLKDDLGRMLKSEKHSDIQLKSENVMLPAHKSILSARSPVFSTMFDQDMVENKSGIVDIADCDSSTLKLFLGYLYYDELQISDSETALKLLLVAEKYQVLTLKELCCCFLVDNFADGNVCKILVAADMIRHIHLKSSALNYIKTHSKSFFNSSEGRKWVANNPNLAAEIISLF